MAALPAQRHHRHLPGKFPSRLEAHALVANRLPGLLAADVDVAQCLEITGPPRSKARQRLAHAARHQRELNRHWRRQAVDRHRVAVVGDKQTVRAISSGAGLQDDVNAMFGLVHRVLEKLKNHAAQAVVARVGLGAAQTLDQVRWHVNARGPEALKDVLTGHFTDSPMQARRCTV